MQNLVTLIVGKVISLKHRKLKGYVLPTLYVIVLIVIFGAVTLVSNLMQVNPNYLYSVDVMRNVDTPVVSEVEESSQIVRPYTSSDVKIATYFYDVDASEEEQQKSLIYFENTYMKNTGVLYQSDNLFDCVAVLEGTVLNIKEDDILGNVVEIEHNPNLRTIYYSLGEVNVKVGEVLNQGDLIGISGENNITDANNNLLFEVYYNGTLLNPEEFYTMDVSTLN